MAGINFRSYQNVTKITIGNNTVCNNNFQNAFAGMNNMTNCTFPIKNIVDMSNAFSNCQNLSGELVFPESLKSIGHQAFAECKNITSIKLNNGLEHIDERAFERCKGLTGTINIPPSVTMYENYIFNQSYNITGICFYGNMPTLLGYNSHLITYYYVNGNSTWRISDTDSETYDLKIFIPKDAPFSRIKTTFDTTEITLTEGDIFTFSGKITTEAEGGFKRITVKIYSDSKEVIYKKITNVKSTEFSLAEIPSFVVGENVKGTNDNGKPKMIRISAGEKWYVEISAIDADGEKLDATVKCINTEKAD